MRYLLSLDIQGSKADLQLGKKKNHLKGKKQLPKGKFSELFSNTIKCNIADNQSVSKSKGRELQGNRAQDVGKDSLRAERMKDVRQMQLQLPSSLPQGRTLPFIETFYIF